MKLAQYKLSRRMKFRGLDVSIETDEGEIRHWKDEASGTEGKTKFRVPYGYIRRTEGMDGDHVDVFIGPYENADNVYVIHQMKLPDFKKFDEDKCMLGFGSAEEAKAMYLNHFDDNRFFGSMTTMPFEEFKRKVLATFEAPKKLAAALQYRQEKPMSLSQALRQFTKTGGVKTLSDTEHEVEDITRKLRGFARRHPFTRGSESDSNLASKTLDSNLTAKAASAPYVLGAQHAASFFRPKTATPRTNMGDAIRKAGKEMSGGHVGAEQSVALKRLSKAVREKKAEGEMDPSMMGGAGPSLGDPNFWGGGSQAPQEGAQQPQDAEEAISLLPGGTFQGASIRIAPDGQKSTSVKVSPDALSDPTSLMQFFQLPEPGAKIEIAAPDQVPTVPVQGGMGGMGAAPVAGGAAPAEGGGVPAGGGM